MKTSWLWMAVILMTVVGCSDEFLSRPETASTQWWKA